MGVRHLLSHLKRTSLALLDLVLPEYCVVCKREGSYLCADCEPDLPPLQRPYCFLCASPRVPQLCDSCRRRAPGVRQRASAIRVPRCHSPHGA